MMVEAVERLAAPADQQVAYLKRLGTAPCADELALELNYIVAMLDQFVAQGLLSPVQASAIQAVDQKLDQMSGSQNDELWWEEALHRRPEWAEVRRLAATALAELSGRDPL